MPIRHASKPFHSLVLPGWVIAASTAVSSNPLHNVLLIAILTLVVTTCQTDGPSQRGWGVFVRLGIALLLLRMVFSVIAIGGIAYGTTPLVVLPQLRLPVWLGGLRLGGTATAEMLLGGLNSGLRLLCLILLVGAFNTLADQYALLRRTPRWLLGAGLVVTIALAWIPQTLLQLQAIREAQRVRGRQGRQGGGALPMVVPLLAGGLERATQLAEAMDSRGYGRSSRSERRVLGEQALLLAGVILLALGLFAALGYRTAAALGWGASVVGSVLLGLGIRSLQQGVVISHYRRERWALTDLVVLGVSAMAALGLLVLQATMPATLAYSPFPHVSLPLFSPLAAGVSLLLLVPAAVHVRGSLRSPHVDS